MDKAYVRAQQASYAGQANTFTIPANKLDKIVTIPLGFQPLGITSLHGKIAIAAYFEPAICLAEVSRDSKGLRFELEWIRGVRYGGETVRLFPDFLKKGEANRAQTAVWKNEKCLLVSRNADNKFFCLAKDEAGWVFTGQTIQVPTNLFVWSAELLDVNLFTIETSLNTSTWRFRSYMLDHAGRLESMRDDDIGAFFSGNAWYDGCLYHVTDFRSPEPRGIYRGKKLIIKKVYGNGLCFLPDGSMLVSRYGQASNGPFSGEPGALIYVPASLLSI